MVALFHVASASSCELPCHTYTGEAIIYSSVDAAVLSPCLASVECA